MATTSAPMTASALREAESATMLHTPERVLMDRAAAAIRAEVGDFSPVALLVGRGNNGGDALLAGALLATGGAHVTAILLAPDAHPRGLSMLAEAGGRVLAWATHAAEAAEAISEARSVIDGIVGLGGRAGLRPLVTLTWSRT